MTQHVYLTVDLGFGDAGKGSVVDYLTRRFAAHTVVRFNGGAQAGHRVVSADNRAHVFAQFGSGTLAGADTYLSRFMLLDPPAMDAEADHLRALGVADPTSRVTIDEQALVVTPFQRAANRLKELARGAGRHGSCGMGIGETMADWLADPAEAVHAADLARPDVLRPRLAAAQARSRAKIAPLLPALAALPAAADELAVLTDPTLGDWLIATYGDFARRVRIVPGSALRAVLRRPGAVVFEAAQGVLLDEWRGFHPHTTWSTTTTANAVRLLAEAGYDGPQTRIGITRAYATRHGAGPLPSEDAALTQALPDAANGFGRWQEGFRVGWLDLVLLRYALAVSGPLDLLAVTCLDRLAAVPAWSVCAAYRDGDQTVTQLTPSPVLEALDYQERLTALLQRVTPLLEPVADGAALVRRVAQAAGVPVGLLSAGPTAADKVWLAGKGRFGRPVNATAEALLVA